MELGNHTPHVEDDLEGGGGSGGLGRRNVRAAIAASTSSDVEPLLTRSTPTSGNVTPASFNVSALHGGDDKASLIGGISPTGYAVLILLAVQNCSKNLLMRYVMKDRPEFLTSAAVLGSEFTKLTLSVLFIVFYEKKTLASILHYLHLDMRNTLLLAVPATAYNFQMKLEYVALANLNAAVFSVLVQTKLLFTAVMAYAVLSKKLKYIQVISLVLLTVGVMLCNMSNDSTTDWGSAAITGIAATLGIALSSGFASVYTEKVIKAQRNPSLANAEGEYGLAYTQVQLAFMSICTIGAYALWQDLPKIVANGLFYKFTGAAVLSVFNSAIGGLIVASVLKYADSVLKGYATAMSVILTGVLSMVLFQTELSMIYFLGIINVVTAVLLYNGKDLDQVMCIPDQCLMVPPVAVSSTDFIHCDHTAKMKDLLGEEPDGLMKSKDGSGRYGHVGSTDRMTRPSEVDGIHKIGNDNDLRHRLNAKSNSDFYHGRFPMDISSSSSISRNERRQSIHWSHVWEQIKSMFRIALPYFYESKQSRWLVAGLFFFMLLDNGASVAYSYVSRDFWSALAEQSSTKFYTNLGKYIATLLIMAPIDAMYIYYQSQFGLHWRAWLTTRTIQLYTNNQVYYNIEVGRNKEMHTQDPHDTGMGNLENRNLIDNPDQRITEDVEAFTRLSIQLCFELFGTFIQVFSFAAILWTIYPQLLWIALAYSFGGTIITTWLGHPLIQLNVEHLRREADLRYSLVRFRENAEAIAFYLSAAFLEQSSLASRLKYVVTNQYRINLITRTLYLFTFTYNLTRSILPVVIMAPQYFAGKIEMGVINQSSGAFSTVVMNLSTIVVGFDTISQYAANIERLSRFYQAMANADEVKRKHWSPSRRQRQILRVALNTEGTAPPDNSISNDDCHKDNLLGQFSDDVELQEIEDPNPMHLNGNGSPSSISNGYTDDNHNKSGSSNSFSGVGTIDLQRHSNEGNIVLQIDHLDLVTPNRTRRLIHDLNVTVTSGQHLLIVGASGVGKSSLLRAIAGLWKTGYGRIVRPADEDVYFLPQQPYCPLGSLREQLLYPSLSQQQRASEPVDDITDWSFRSVECVPSDMNRSSPSRPVPSNIADEDLIRILEQINFIDIATRAGDGNPLRGLNVVMDWSHVLSLGERQRLAFGRLLLHRPKRLVVLDEATSALDLYNEKCMYRLLQEMAADPASATTFVSVGHRPSLAEFHTMRLDLGETVQESEAEYVLSTI